MTDARPTSRGRHRSLVPAVLAGLILASWFPSSGQAAQEQTIATLSARLDRLESLSRINETAEISQQIGLIQKDLDALKRTVDEIKRTVDDGKTPQPAPPEAWQALMVVGAVFGLAWGVVSIRREKVRECEVVLNAAVKALVAERQAEEELAARVARLRKAIGELPRSSARDSWFSFLFKNFGGRS